MLKKILVALVVILAGFAGFVASRPGSFRIERSGSIAAAPGVVFALVNDFHRWSEWSPWEKLDPAMKKAHSGSAAGAGAVYEWAGNDQAGQGRMTLTESSPADRIGIKLEFIKPWEATNALAFRFKPEGTGTRVIWSMDGTNNIMAKAASLFMDMDKLVGKDFETGLAQLKTVSEAEAQKAAAAAEAASAAAAAATPPPPPAGQKP